MMAAKHKPPTDADDRLGFEALQVQVWRFDEACRAGLTLDQARAFSVSDADIGLLRYLADCEIDPGLIARIVL